MARGRLQEHEDIDVRDEELQMLCMAAVESADDLRVAGRTGEGAPRQRTADRWGCRALVP